MFASAKVVFLDARGAQSILWQSDVVLVGREASCGVPIDHPMVSQRHCRIFQRDGRWLLENLSNASGTYVNQQLVQGPVPLNHLDQIRCGPPYVQGPGHLPLPTLHFHLVADEGAETFVSGSLADARALKAAREDLQRVQGQLLKAESDLAEERRRMSALTTEHRSGLLEIKAQAEQLAATREDLRLSRESADRAGRHRVDSERRARGVQENLDQLGQEAARLRQEIEDKRQQVLGQERSLRDKDAALVEVRTQLVLEQQRLSEARQTRAAREESDRQQQRLVAEQHRGEVVRLQRRGEELAQQLQDKTAECARLALVQRDQEGKGTLQEWVQRDLEAQVRQLTQQLVNRDGQLAAETQRAEELAKKNEKKNQEWRGHQDQINRLEEALKKQEEAAGRNQRVAQRVKLELTAQIEDLKVQLSRAPHPQNAEAKAVQAQLQGPMQQVAAALSGLRDELRELRRLSRVSSPDDPLAESLGRALGLVVDAEGQLALLRAVG